MLTYCVNKPPAPRASRARSAAWPTLLVAMLVLAGCGSAPPRVQAPASQLAPQDAQGVAMHAMGLVGTPYRYGGNTPEGGFDCSGLIGYVFRHSSSPVQPPRTVAQISGWGASVPAGVVRTGDLVIFGARASAPTHAGIYVGEGRFVHAPSSGGTVRMDRLDGPYWSRQHVSFRRP